MQHARYLRLPSRHLGRSVHLWTYGWWGRPVVVFPSAAGMAHEWQASTAIEALAPLIEAGRIKLYCPESNVSEAWTGQADPSWRLDRHQAYERFVLDELVPWIREDCRSPRIRIATTGASFGAFYASNLALKNPELVEWALCLSGRYRTDAFLNGAVNDDRVYFADPLRYVPNLHGAELRRLRHTHLTLVVGRGPHEGRCITETLDLARALASRGIPHTADVWGRDVAHDWTWWKRQLVHHMTARYS